MTVARVATRADGWHIEPSTWTSRVHELVEEEKVVIKPYTLEMTYCDWDYRTYV